MAVLKKNFEKEFDCKIADSTLGVFYSMIACFERTGSVPQCLFYFVVEDTVSNIENNPRWQPKIVANPITRIEEMESEEEDAEESEGEWFGDTNGGDNDSTSDPLAAGQLMLVRKMRFNCVFLYLLTTFSFLESLQSESETQPKNGYKCINIVKYLLKQIKNAFAFRHIDPITRKMMKRSCFKLLLPPADRILEHQQRHIPEISA